MWCYQKPGFHGLLLAELQQQQQRNQFCDTLLRTEGVSVPVHSCILSAFSPHISSVLSSEPSPPPGQSHVVDFGALGACSLLHVVRLFYSGEMAGEGEKEKQEAISAAAKLGIHGLVEVTRRDNKSRHGEERRRHAEAEVQTEPEESEGRREKWRRDVRDGLTFLWKETPSDGQKDAWTQTEELLGNAAPSHHAVSYDTIDIAAFQSLREPEPSFISSQMPYVPFGLIYQPDANQAHQPFSAATDDLQGSAAAGQTQPNTNVSSSIPSGSCDQSWLASPGGAPRDVAVNGELENQRLNQFRDNIPGYIDYFFKPEAEGDSPSGRGRGMRTRGAANVRRARTGERRARRPQASTGRRGRGGLTQKVDVQEVGVSSLQKFFLQKSRRRVSKTGQGGGAAGRSLCLETRELLKTARKGRRTALVTFWKDSPSRNAPLRGGGAGNTKRGKKKNAAPASKQAERPVSRPQRVKAKPTSPPLSSPRMQPSSTLWSSNPCVQPSPSTSLLSPAVSYMSPAVCPLPTTSVCPSVPPTHQENISQLLEDVSLDFDILPNNNIPHPQRLPPAGSSSRTSVETSAQIKQHHGAAEERGADGSSSANAEALVVQEQSELDLNEMLENILLSFEQHFDSRAAGKEVEMGCQSDTTAPASSPQLPERQQNNRDEAPSASPDVSSHERRTDGISGKVAAKNKVRRKRRSSRYKLSFGKKNERKLRRLTDATTRHKRKMHEELQQDSLVNQERSLALPVRETLQELSCQSLNVKNISKTKTSLSAKSQQGKLSGKSQKVYLRTRTYPLRSRSLHTDRMQILEEPPLLHNQPPPTGQTGVKTARLRKNAHHHKMFTDESSAPAEFSSSRSAALIQDQADVPTMKGERRKAEAEEDSDDCFVGKRVCLEQTPQQTCEGNASHCLTGGEKSSGKGRTDVDGDFEEPCDRESITAPPESKLDSAGCWEDDKSDDVDVDGGASPIPDPVTITWTESSEDNEEDEDVDVDN